MEISKKKLLLLPIDYGRRKLAPNEIVTVRVDEKNGVMAIGKPAMIAMTMGDHFYRLFYDVSNSVIAWQIKASLEKDEMETKTWKLAKPSPSNGILGISIKRILDAFGTKPEGGKSYKCVVKKHATKDELLENGDYYFIELNEPFV